MNLRFDSFYTVPMPPFWWGSDHLQLLYEIEIPLNPFDQHAIRCEGHRAAQILLRRF
jgi:hypothetical protein